MNDAGAWIRIALVMGVGIVCCQSVSAATYDAALSFPDFENWLIIAMVAVAVFVVMQVRHRRALTSRGLSYDNESRLRSVVDTVVDGIVTIDERGRIESINPAAQRIFGCSESHVIGKNVNMLMPEPYRSEHDGYLLHYLQSNQAKIIGIGREVVGLRQDGSTFPMDLAVSEFKHDGQRMFTGIVRDITDRKRAEQVLEANQARLRSLTSELSFAEERERRRVAVDLHDHIGQTLALAKIRLGALRQAAAQSEYGEAISEIRDLVSGSIDSTRSLTFELGSPILYELGLVAALENVVDQVGRQHGIATEFEDDDQSKPLSDDVAIVLFQAVRELLNNIVKHAGASEAAVRVQRKGRLIHIDVSDDGYGFKVPKTGFSVSRSGGFGLFHISERLEYLGGQFVVESVPSKGTQVQLIAPLSLKESRTP